MDEQLNLTGINVDLDEVQELSSFGVVPEGLYQAELTKQEAVMSKGNELEGKAPKLMLKTEFTIKKPQEWAGEALTDYWVLGTEDNPGGIDKASMG